MKIQIILTGIKVGGEEQILGAERRIPNWQILRSNIPASHLVRGSGEEALYQILEQLEDLMTSPDFSFEWKEDEFDD